MKMKILYYAFPIMFLLLSACASTPTSDASFQRIDTKKQYEEIVVGRLLKVKGTTFSSRANADGTMEGGDDKRRISGTWTWEEGFFCREGIIGAEKLERDCQIIEYSGNTIKVIRNRGKGDQAFLQIQ